MFESSEQVSCLIYFFLKYSFLKHHSGCCVKNRLQVVKGGSRDCCSNFDYFCCSHSYSKEAIGRVQAANDGSFNQREVKVVKSSQNQDHFK